MRGLIIWLTVAVTLLRELIRACAVPLRLLCYLPYRHRWRRAAEEALQAAHSQAEEQDDDALADFMAKRRPPRGSQPHLFVSAGEASGELHAAPGASSRRIASSRVCVCSSMST